MPSRLRPPTRDDAQAVLAVVLARDVADVGEPDYTLEDLLDEWDAEGFDLAADAVVTEDLAGYAMLRHDQAVVAVHPDAEGRGIGAALLAWAERRAAERGDDRHRQDVGERNARGRALLEAHGYRRVRSYWRMTIASAGVAPGAPAPPAGFAARRLDRNADARGLHEVNERAFGSVAAYRGEPLERFVEEHLQASTLSDDLSVVADAGGRIGGFALVRDWSDEGRGYVDLLAVDPEVRGGGVGSWLLRTAFARCRDAGLAETMLGVAADNPRAVTLYERAGMRVRFRIDSYERPVSAGAAPAAAALADQPPS